MIATIVARHSPQDIALTRSLMQGRVVRTHNSDACSYYRATERRWSPQSQEARFFLAPIAA